MSTNRCRLLATGQRAQLAAPKDFGEIADVLKQADYEELRQAAIAKSSARAVAVALKEHQLAAHISTPEPMFDAQPMAQMCAVLRRAQISTMDSTDNMRVDRVQLELAMAIAEMWLDTVPPLAAAPAEPGKPAIEHVKDAMNILIGSGEEQDKLMQALNQCRLAKAKLSQNDPSPSPNRGPPTWRRQQDNLANHYKASTAVALQLHGAACTLRYSHDEHQAFEKLLNVLTHLEKQQADRAGAYVLVPAGVPVTPTASPQRHRDACAVLASSLQVLHEGSIMEDPSDRGPPPLLKLTVAGTAGVADIEVPAAATRGMGMLAKAITDGMAAVHPGAKCEWLPAQAKMRFVFASPCTLLFGDARSASTLGFASLQYDALPVIAAEGRPVRHSLAVALDGIVQACNILLDKPTQLQWARAGIPGSAEVAFAQKSRLGNIPTVPVTANRLTIALPSNGSRDLPTSVRISRPEPAQPLFKVEFDDTQKRRHTLWAVATLVGQRVVAVKMNPERGNVRVSATRAGGTVLTRYDGDDPEYAVSLYTACRLLSVRYIENLKSQSVVCSTLEECRYLEDALKGFLAPDGVAYLMQADRGAPSQPSPMSSASRAQSALTADQQQKCFKAAIKSINTEARYAVALNDNLQGLPATLADCLAQGPAITEDVRRMTKAGFEVFLYNRIKDRIGLDNSG